MKMLKRIVSIMIIVMIIGSLSLTVSAENSSEYYQEKHIEAEQNSQDTQTQIDDVSSQIDEVLQAVADLNSSISNYESEIQQLTEKAEDLEQSIQEKEEELKEKNKILENRLVAMYMKKQVTFLDVVLSGNLINFISNKDLVKQIAEYDNKLISEVEDLKTTLESEKKEVEEVKSQKEQKSKELQNLKAEKEEKAASLTEEQKQLETQLAEYRAQAEEYAELERQAIAKEEEQRKAAEEAAKKANEQNNTSSNSSDTSDPSTVTPYQGGKLGWPCPSSSRITSQYGYRILFGVRDFHTGVDIGASTGSNIVAAESGTVILASYGWNGGYGNYIIINHGNGITTRYAHASQLFVTAGQTVSKGQVIAAVGTTGNSTGPHLHFEVRLNGAHKNPLNYL